MVVSRNCEPDHENHAMSSIERPHRLSMAESNTGTPSATSGHALNPERWVEDQSDALFGFAALRVRDRAIAQDLVQETFLAAIKAKESFAGRSTERSWLFGILRNKLADYYRLQYREGAIADLESPLPEEESAFAANGLGKDGWVMRLAPK